MSSRSVTFTRPAARRIVKAVREVEALPDQRAGQRNLRTPALKATLWAKLTGRGDSDHLWYYAWSEVQRQHDDTWAIVDGGRSGTTTENPALEANNTTDTSFINKIVLLRRMPVKQEDGSWVTGWGFSALGGGPSIIRFPARLTDSAGAFEEVYRLGGAWVTLTGGRTDTSSIELNGAQGWVGNSGTGTVVMMEKIGGLWVFDYSFRISNDGTHGGYASALDISNTKGSHNVLGLSAGAAGASLAFKGLGDPNQVLQLDETGANVIFDDVKLTS